LRISFGPVGRSITLGVRFPKAKLNTPSTPPELVERHRGRARVHGVVPIEPAKRSERAIHVVDTIIRNHDRLAIHYPIFGHGLISPGYFTALSRTRWGYRGVQAVKRRQSGCGAPILMQTIDVPSLNSNIRIGEPNDQRSCYATKVSVRRMSSLCLTQVNPSHFDRSATSIGSATVSS
jgi:hypothetical protein